LCSVTSPYLVQVSQPFDTMSKGQKICCGVCCGIIVILVIMIPVGLFAIAPKLSQHYLDQSTLQITNATLYYPSKRENQHWAIQIVHANMHNPAPFGVTVKKFKQKMFMYSSEKNLSLIGAGFPNITGQQLAEFEFPELKLKKGNNEIAVTVNMTLVSGHDDCGKSSSCFGIFQTLAAFSRGFGLGAYMQLSGDDMHVKSMGLGVPGKFSSSFELNCSVYGFMNETTGKWEAQVSPENPVNVSEIPECIAAGGCVKPSQIMCDTSSIPASAEPGYTTTTTTPSMTTTTMAVKEFLM